MTESSENIPTQVKTTESSQDNSENISLLPRSAWNSQVTYLKVLLKTKQALDAKRY